MVVVFLATDGFDGAVQRISLLHGRASDPLASQLVRFIFSLLVCVWLGSSRLWFVGSCGGEGGVLYWTSFFNLVEVGGVSFCFPCCGRSGSVDVRSTFSIRRRGGSATLALVTISKVWSYASVTACGCRASSLLVVSRRRDGWERRPVKRSSSGPLCAKSVFL
jgi:hypothetical protein